MPRLSPLVQRFVNSEEYITIDEDFMLDGDYDEDEDYDDRYCPYDNTEILEYYTDFYEWFCPEGCDKQNCPVDSGKCLISVQGFRIDTTCKKAEKRVYMRMPLCDLTEREAKWSFSEEFLKDIGDRLQIFSPRSAADIPHDTPEEKQEHDMLLERCLEFLYSIDRQPDLPEYKILQWNFSSYLSSLANAARWQRYEKNKLKESKKTLDISAEQPSHATPSTVPDNSSTSPTMAGAMEGAKKETANEKLRSFLDKNPECRSLTHNRLAVLIGETPETVRKTPTWIALSKGNQRTKKQNAIRLKLNNAYLSKAERDRLENELEELKAAEKRES